MDSSNGETHLEIKGPVGSEIRKAAGLGPSITKQGKKLGFKMRNQLNYWFNPNIDTSGVTQPESRNKVLIVNDLFDVPSTEKSQMESSINFGLKGEHPILFINNKINREMNETFKSLIENYQGNLKIVKQTFSDEIISNKTLHSCTFIKLIFLNWQ